MTQESAWIPLSEAARLAGVSRPTMSRIIASGLLQIKEDPFDRRVKLVNRDELLALKVRDKAA
jgi:DNA-binding MarR family transcriptional regulator